MGWERRTLISDTHLSFLYTNSGVYIDMLVNANQHTGMHGVLTTAASPLMRLASGIRVKTPRPEAACRPLACSDTSPGTCRHAWHMGTDAGMECEQAVHLLHDHARRWSAAASSGQCTLLSVAHQWAGLELDEGVTHMSTQRLPAKTHATCWTSTRRGGEPSAADSKHTLLCRPAAEATC